MIIKGIKTSLFQERDSLEDFIKKNIPLLQEGDIVVITSKIIALAEGGVGKIEDKLKLLKQESEKIIETPWAHLTLTKDGWGINVGIDESNADNKLLLLPKDSFASAENVLEYLKIEFLIEKLGVIITDTRSVPLRRGTIGRALGYAGFEPLKSYIGKKDLYGRESRLTQSNHADALAAAAVLEMGEGDERIPLVIIKKAPVTFTSQPFSKEVRDLHLSPEKDIFSKIFISNEQKSNRLPKKE